MPENIYNLIREHDIKFIDYRFTDIMGQEQHISVPASQVNQDSFELGKMFDGSSFRGWKDIHNSDMILMPDPSSAVLDPFFEETTLLVRCDIIEPTTMKGYQRDPRSIARRAEEYLKSTGIADTCYFGPEPEFFLLDDVRWDNGMSGAYYRVDSQEAAWNTGREIREGNLGHRPTVKGGYFPVPPIDSSHLALLTSWRQRQDMD